MNSLRNIKVLESQVSHVYDVLYYKDGSTRHMGEERSSVITQSINVKLLTANKELKLIPKSSSGTLIFTKKTNTQTITGIPDEGQKKRPVIVTSDITIELTQEDSQFHPRLANLTLGDMTAKKIIWLYPGLKHSHGQQQAIYGQAVFSDGTPASWSLLELEVEYKPQKTITLYAQADHNGDFDMPLKGLPLRPQNINHYPAKLLIKSQSEAQIQAANQIQDLADPDTFLNKEVGSHIDNQIVTYDDKLTINLIPEIRTRIMTEGTQEKQLIINHL